jgi:hypothetical protein
MKPMAPPLPPEQPARKKGWARCHWLAIALAVGLAVLFGLFLGSVAVGAGRLSRRWRPGGGR